MSQQVISYADLSIINNALRSISADMEGVHSELGSLNNKQDQLEVELLQLASSFSDFVESDMKQKALQLAETRQGNLKQDLQIKFGYYAEVRRMATGILQGVDTGIVSDDTLRFTTEEIMIKAPGYWLAPALVTLVSWIRNDKVSYEKALNESLKRDDYKTTLFFMLVMRRLSKNEAALKWLERYFMHQNPHHLRREFIVVLEAVTTGIFPPASRQLMMGLVKKWLDELTRGDSYINEQKIQWIAFFEANGPLCEGEYPLLEQFSINWNALGLSLREAKTHAVLLTYFNEIFTSSSDSTKAIKVQLGEILSMLAVNFDDDELPLQRQVRLNQLIIQADGDKKAAQALMDTEKHIFEEEVDFLQLLTNAAFNPELSGATKVTQALAVSVSQAWIVEAHDIFTANSRNKVPEKIELYIDGFRTDIKDGTDESEQIQRHGMYWTGFLENELSKLQFPFGELILGIILCVIGFWGFSLHVLLGVGGLVFGIWLIWSSNSTHKKAKQSIEENIAQRQMKSAEVLRGCIAETVDYRKELSTEDEMAEDLRQLITSITPEDFSGISKNSRTILQIQ